MGYSRYVEFEELREVAFGSITNSFTNFGSPLSLLGIILGFSNNTDQKVYISIHGIKKNICLAAYQSKVYDFRTNANWADGKYLAKKTQMKIKYDSAAPTLGEVVAEVVG